MACTKGFRPLVLGPMALDLGLYIGLLAYVLGPKAPVGLVPIVRASGPYNR